jgi:hypothetical protein
MNMRRALLTIVLAALALPASASAYPVTPISATQGAPIPSTTVVASFDDPGPVPIIICNASAYHATIDWGDGGGPQAAAVSAVTPSLTCRYLVRAGHTYTAAGRYALTVNVTGGGNPGSATGTATVAPAELTALSPVTISATAGQPFDGVLGGFSDAFTGAPTSDFTATVNWGDGAPATAGTVTATSLQGTFVVEGTHSYATQGTRPLSVAVSAKGGGTTTLSGTAKVVPGATPPGSPKPFKLSLGTIVRRKQRAFSMKVGCPKRQASCRGKVVLYWVRGGQKRRLGSKLFLLAGGTKATLDVVIGKSDARAIARSRFITLRAAVSALDPSTNRAAAQSKTTLIRIRR